MDSWFGSSFTDDPKKLAIDLKNTIKVIEDNPGHRMDTLLKWCRSKQFEMSKVL